MVVKLKENEEKEKEKNLMKDLIMQ